MGWIDLAQDRERGQAFVDVTNGFHKMRGISLLAENWLASQGLGYMEKVTKYVSK
jgi:hypothetical protein